MIYFYGGQDCPDQINRLVGYELERTGKMKFKHGDGSCSSVKDKRVFMCFDNYGNLCRQMTERPPHYGNIHSTVPHTELPETKFDHIGGPICASESKNSK